MRGGFFFFFFPTQLHTAQTQMLKYICLQAGKQDITEYVQMVYAQLFSKKKQTNKQTNNRT